LLVEDVSVNSAGRGGTCSESYLSSPARVVEHDRDNDSIKFDVSQTFKENGPLMLFTVDYVNSNGDGDVQQCTKEEEVAFNATQTYTVKCVGGFASVGIYFQDFDGFLRESDDFRIPERCDVNPDYQGTRCGFIFKAPCDCLNANCTPSGSFCVEQRDCCTGACNPDGVCVG